jgi:FkbM family methyltransferase
MRWGALRGHSRMGGHASDQPFAHALVWRLNEAGVRGASKLWPLAGVAHRPEQRLVCLRDGTWILNDPWDHVARQSYHGGYERAERWACRQVVRPGGLVLDIGANYGIYTQLASKLVGPNGKVVAFEPGPALTTLEEIIARAGLANVELVPSAVGSVDGQLAMAVPGHQPALATLRLNAEQLDIREVTVTRLDTCIAIPEGDIDLIKIDTEGYEAQVLEGARGLLEARRVRAILLEVSPNFGPIDYVDRFAQEYDLTPYTLGYEVGLRYAPQGRPFREVDVHDQVNVLMTRTDIAFEPR